MVIDDDIALTEAILRHGNTLGAAYKQEREPRKVEVSVNASQLEQGSQRGVDISDMMMTAQLIEEDRERKKKEAKKQAKPKPTDPPQGGCPHFTKQFQFFCQTLHMSFKQYCI